MHWFIRKLANTVKRSRKARAPRRDIRRAFLLVESLEERDLMSISPVFLPVHLPLPVLPPSDPIAVKYADLGGASGFLGKAVTGEMATPYGGGRYEKYQNGAIFWSAKTGAHDIYGPIGAEFFATANEKDAYGNVVEKLLALPTSDETNLSGMPGALTATFQGGIIDYSAGTGAHVVYGAIGAKFAATANETDACGNNVQTLLGLPTSDEKNVPGVSGARENTFQGGVILWSPGTGAHVVYGAIGAKYTSLGGAAAYGLPTSDEANVPGLSGVRVSYFQNGRAIFWSAQTGAHTVYGAIGVEYAATAQKTDYYGLVVQQILGAPTSDEMNVSGVAGARMNTFQGGVIYWSLSTGAHVVYGAIGSQYQSMGGPTSSLGLPTGDEQGIPGGRVQYFQHGKIVWTPTGGAYSVQAVSSMTFNTGVITFNNGVPVGGSAQLTVFADGSYHFTGHFHDSGFLSYNDTLVFGLKSTSGVLYTFAHSGHMAGTIESGSRDDNWDVSGTNPTLAAGWKDLEGAQEYWQASASSDLNSLIQQIEGAAGTVLSVVSVII